MAFAPDYADIGPVLRRLHESRRRHAGRRVQGGERQGRRVQQAGPARGRPALPEPQRRPPAVRPRRLPLHRARRRRQTAATRSVAASTSPPCSGRSSGSIRKPDGDSPYTVPDDNPFVDTDGARPEIYSYGLRNPWRFSFDRDTGDLTIGDVGQDTEEEIDIVGRGDGSGASFGWSAYEGDERFNDDQESPDAIPPVLVAQHSDGNCSITGGVVVRDPDLTSLYGRYLYADLCVGDLRSFTAVPEQPAEDDTALGEHIDRIASFGEGADGTVYAVSISRPRLPTVTGALTLR